MTKKRDSQRVALYSQQAHRGVTDALDSLQEVEDLLGQLSEVVRVNFMELGKGLKPVDVQKIIHAGMEISLLLYQGKGQVAQARESANSALAVLGPANKVREGEE